MLKPNLSYQQRSGSNRWPRRLRAATRSWRPPPSRTTWEFVSTRVRTEAPLFNGDDPLGWIFSIQDYINYFLTKFSTSTRCKPDQSATKPHWGLGGHWAPQPLFLLLYIYALLQHKISASAVGHCGVVFEPHEPQLLFLFVQSTDILSSLVIYTHHLS